VPKIIPIAEAVWPQSTNVTDGRTDFLWHRPDLTVGQKLKHQLNVIMPL